MYNIVKIAFIALRKAQIVSPLPKWRYIPFPLSQYPQVPIYGFKAYELITSLLHSFQAFISNGTRMLTIGQTYIMEQQKQGLDTNQNAQGEQKNNDTANQQQSTNQNSNTNTNRDTDKGDDQKRQEEKQPTQPGTSK
jgi:hypothetical protein